MKKYLIALVFLSSVALISSQKGRHPNTFTLEKIAQDKWAEFPSTDCPLELLNQPFKYIAHGTQMIAFEGKDGKTILKFFLEQKINGKRKSPFRSLTNLIPTLKQKKSIKKQEISTKNLRFAFACYTKAFEELKEESGLIAIHLSPTKKDYPSCIVEDFDGKKWEVDLNRTSFIVQKKVKTVGEIFPTLRTDREKQNFIQAMEQLLEHRTRKGFIELGQGRMFNDNYGFIDDKALVIDVGRLAYREEVKQNPQAEIERMKTRLHNRFSIEK
jgi:hypothetical protein